MNRICDNSVTKSIKESYPRGIMECIELLKKAYGKHFTAEELNPQERLQYPETFIKFQNKKSFTYCLQDFIYKLSR